MKIAIPSTGKDEKSLVDSRFGRCAYFLIGESKDGKLKPIANKAIEVSRGAGVSAAQLVADQKVEAVIGVNFGPRAFWVLTQAGVELYQADPKLTIAQTLVEFEKGNLKKLENPTGPGWQK